MTKEEALEKIKELEVYIQAEDSKIDIEMVLVDLGEKPFYMSKYLVTQELYEKVTKERPSRFVGNPLLPVENVSYNDIVTKFLHKLNKLTGKNYRLPTEYEWLLAALPIPQDIGDYAVINTIKTMPVGSKLPNELGIYDLFGNVWEWTNTLYKKESLFRVLRGDSWGGSAAYCRSAHRSGSYADDRSDNLGFRLVFNEDTDLN